MAYPVLAWFRTVALLFLAPTMVVFAQTPQPATMHCTADPSARVPKSQQETLKELQHSAESGPLYRELVSMTGKPRACKVAWKDGDLTLSYSFNEQGLLQVTITPALESAEERLKLPKSPSITEKRALALLKAAVKHSFPPAPGESSEEDSCGMKWSESKETTSSKSREVSYWGDTCNCQARKVYQGDRITELIVSSAC